jgi:hypothetical protein
MTICPFFNILLGQIIRFSLELIFCEPRMNSCATIRPVSPWRMSRFSKGCFSRRKDGARNPPGEKTCSPDNRKEKEYLMKEKMYRSASRDDLKNPDYSYIKRDLRRILVIASSFIIIMVVLSILFK